MAEQGKKFVDVTVVIEEAGTDNVLAQESITVTAHMLDPGHRDFNREPVETVGLRVQEVFAHAYYRACPPPAVEKTDSQSEPAVPS
jgi:hypothetical protein